MSFLNNVLQRTEGDLIVDVVMNDPNNFPLTGDSKMSIVDVRCTDQLQNQYIIEMQVVFQQDLGAMVRGSPDGSHLTTNGGAATVFLGKEDYAGRAQYYNALGLSKQLASGDEYDKLVPVIFVGILDFNLFEETNYVSHHRILDTDTNRWHLKKLEWHFIELKKFKKDSDELETILDKWIYFFKHALKLHDIPASLSDPVLKEAFGVLEQHRWTKAELDAYDRYLDALRNYASQLSTAKEQGIEIGRKEGKEEGKQEAMIAMAIQFLDIVDVRTIAQKTGLSLEIVEALKNEYERKK